MSMDDDKTLEESPEYKEYLNRQIKLSRLKSITRKKEEEIGDSLKGKYAEISVKRSKIYDLTKEINIIEDEIKLIQDEISSYTENALRDFKRAELEFRTGLSEGDLVEDSDGDRGILVFNYSLYGGSWQWRKLKKDGKISDKISYLKNYTRLKKVDNEVL